MRDLVRINEEIITPGGFIKLLKLTGRFNALMDELIKEKLTVHAARLAGLKPTDEAIQEHADSFRRERGLHRAVDMNRWLEMLEIDLDEFEAFITENLLYEEMNSRVVNDEAVEEYFKLHSPLFDAVDVSHIVIESEGTAKEIAAVLTDEPDMFEELAREHSIADTSHKDGHLGRVLRGMLSNEMEAKIFQADEGAILGPFAVPGSTKFEVFRINRKKPASLESETIDAIKGLIREEWIAARASESRIEAL